MCNFLVVFHCNCIYCCPVWARSSFMDTQLHSGMRLISGCLQPTQLSWLPVLNSVAPPSLCHKAATDNMLQIIEACPNWPMYCVCWCLASTSMACISTPNLWSDMTSVNTVTQWREGWSSDSVVSHTIVDLTISDSQVSISLVKHGLWWTVAGQVKAHVLLTCTNGVSPNHLPVIVASNRPWTTLSTRVSLLHEADGDAVIWLESTATAALAK